MANELIPVITVAHEVFKKTKANGYSDTIAYTAAMTLSGGGHEGHRFMFREIRNGKCECSKYKETP